MRREVSTIVALTVVLAGCVCSLIMISDSVGAMNWTISTLDTAGFNGEWVSIALDSNGYPHISYYEALAGNLRYAYWNGSYWHKVAPDTAGDIGRFTSIAVDSIDNIHISYLDGTNEDLRYARWNGSAWLLEAVDSVDRVGAFTSIAVDSSDYPHIAYFDESYDDLKYAKWNGVSWDIETVDSTGITGYYNSLELDSNDYPHISYLDVSNEDLKYAKWNGSEWTIQTVDSLDTVGYWTSLALDNNDNAHISYYDATRTSLRYAKWSGTSWVIHTIDDLQNVGESTAIDLDSQGDPHISYFFSNTDDLKYARWTGDSWAIETVDAIGRTGDYTSIALDDNDCRHIAYRDILNTDLKYAKACPETPLPPENLVATAGDAQVTLSWSKPLDDGGLSITNYRIHRGDTSGGEVLIDEIDRSLIYVDTGLSNGHTYYYKISAVNGVGEGALTSEVSARPIGPPYAPQNLVASRGDRRINLTWDAPSFDGGTPITNYRIYRGNSSGGELFHVEIGNQLYYEETGLQNGQEYYYRLSAVNIVGEGPLSNEASGTPATSPMKPRGLVVSSGDKYVHLNWDSPEFDGGSEITNYRIHRGTSSNEEVFYQEIGNVLSFNDTNVLNGVNYFYKVSAVNAVGEGALSYEASTTPMTVPGFPTNISITPSNSRVMLSWSPPTDDGGSPIIGYTIYRGTSMDSLTTLIELGSVLAYNDTMVDNGILYYFSVSARNSVGEGEMSEVSKVMPYNQPPECTITTPSSGSKLRGRVTISGTASDSDGIVKSVEIRVGSINWIVVGGTENWTYHFDTANLPDGNHVIHARSYDGENYSSLASVEIRIENKSSSVFSELWFLLAIIISITIGASAFLLVRARKKKEEDITKGSREGKKPRGR